MKLLSDNTCAVSNSSSASDSSSASKLVCPLCGKPNACALEINGDIATPCWCTIQKIDPAVLAKIPEHLRNLSCICQGCAEKK
ncbi:MAG: cysteine-rich CWC family protein [Pseudomonadota bacterium]